MVHVSGRGGIGKRDQVVHGLGSSGQGEGGSQVDHGLWRFGSGESGSPCSRDIGGWVRGSGGPWSGGVGQGTRWSMVGVAPPCHVEWEGGAWSVP